jgi:hypothetical protein
MAAMIKRGQTLIRHSGESRNLFDVNGIPALAGMKKFGDM